MYIDASDISSGKTWDEEQEYTSAESLASTATPRTPANYETLRIKKKTLSICGDNSWVVGLRVYVPRLSRRNTAVERAGVLVGDNKSFPLTLLRVETCAGFVAAIPDTSLIQ